MKVLLTGISGFLGSHTAIQLLEKGYTVVGTIRDMGRAESIKKIIAQHTSKVANLTIVEADLMDSAIWLELTKDVDYVQHVASPFPRELPKNEDELIIPAREGALNVLKAAVANGVKRVVLTSSVVAIQYGKTPENKEIPTSEADWTDPTVGNDCSPYYKSKAIAERAAWDFINNINTKTELTTVLPGGILGPVLEKDFGTSANIVLKVLEGSMPAVPKIGFEIVDVRSVANLLILAMESPKAAGERFIASDGYYSFKDVALILKEAYPKRKIPTSEMPDFFVRLISNFEKSLKPILFDLGVRRKIDNTKAQKILGWQPIPKKEAVLACANSLLEQGLVK